MPTISYQCFSPLKVEEGSATTVAFAILLSLNSFSPLKVEEGSATVIYESTEHRPVEVSVLSKSRKGQRRRYETHLEKTSSSCFSPLKVEEGSATTVTTKTIWGTAHSFSPLKVEEGSATGSPTCTGCDGEGFQSSQSRGRVSDEAVPEDGELELIPFQSSQSRGRVSDIRRHRTTQPPTNRVSVLSKSRKGQRLEG